jgi:ribonucleoside-diphosphate reductase alpha chain
MTDDPDVRMAQSIMDYIFRRLALDYLPFEVRSAYGIYSAEERQRQLETGSYEPVDEVDGIDEEDLETFAQSAPVEPPPAPAPKPAAPAAAAVSVAPPTVGSSAELMEAQFGRTADAPLCFSCGTKMRPAGSCYVCEGCGSTSGCS